MKVVVGYPAMPSEKGAALISQNRQFQYFNAPTFIFPVVPAYAATMVRGDGHEVVWLDGVAEEMDYDQYLAALEEADADILAIESKSPTIRRFWKLINYVKDQPEFKKLKIVLMGDHVTALPKESLLNSRVDFVLTGGDYDFALRNLVRFLEGKEKLESGVYWRNRKTDKIETSGKFEITHQLTELPLMDRELVKWRLYSEANGNFKHLPGTYTMFGRDCWWRKPNEDSVSKGVGCTFCSWTSIFPNFRTMSVDQAIAEVKECIRLGIREIFDDTGTLPIGPWLKEFCERMQAEGLEKQIVMGCNMRANALNREQYQMLGRTNFRFILYGVESGSQRTLDMLNKGTKWDDIKQATQWAKEAGLDPHLTCMVGYPWETKEEAQSTIDLARGLFDKGHVDTLQATIVMPYPGTQLYKQCVENGWLRFGETEYEYLDMRGPAMISPIPDDEIYELTQELYKAFLTPRYIWRRLSTIRSFDDLQFIYRAAKQFFGHTLDFSARGNKKLRAAELAEIQTGF